MNKLILIIIAFCSMPHLEAQDREIIWQIDRGVDHIKLDLSYCDSLDVPVIDSIHGENLSYIRRFYCDDQNHKVKEKQIAGSGFYIREYYSLHGTLSLISVAYFETEESFRMVYRTSYYLKNDRWYHTLYDDREIREKQEKKDYLEQTRELTRKYYQFITEESDF